MKTLKTTKPRSPLGKAAARALRRAGQRARVLARRYGTPIHVEARGKVVAVWP
jgi:ribosomal protein L25 (general stress protein Ctc)